MKNTTPFINDQVYDWLKRLVQNVLPAAASLYFGLAQIWGFPNAEAVVGTLALIATFFGVVINVSVRRYEASPEAYDGQIVLTDTAEGKKLFTLALNGDPMNIAEMQSVSFEVVRFDDQ